MKEEQIEVPVSEVTEYPMVNTLDELKQQIDMIASSGRGGYSVGMVMVVNDDTKTITIEK